MASKAAAGTRPKSLAPDILEKLLGILALALFVALLIALIKGRAEWSILPWQVWSHIVTVGTALALTPVMMWRKRGDTLHRRLGWTWSIAMFVTALLTFDIQIINPGNYSWIHLLSILTIISVPLLLWRARKHDISGHRQSVRALVIGALLIAGFFTFPFNRLLGQWLFG